MALAITLNVIAAVALLGVLAATMRIPARVERAPSGA
jgi:hypothetical protein